jgi:ATP-dependent DNA ligase
MIGQHLLIFFTRHHLIKLRKKSKYQFQRQRKIQNKWKLTKIKPFYGIDFVAMGGDYKPKRSSTILHVLKSLTFF